MSECFRAFDDIALHKIDRRIGMHMNPDVRHAVVDLTWEEVLDHIPSRMWDPIILNALEKINR